jgi:hypothetical protein
MAARYKAFSSNPTVAVTLEWVPVVQDHPVYMYTQVPPARICYSIAELDSFS